MIEAQTPGQAPAASDPDFPPGFWRRIAIYPYPDKVVAGVEDDVHRFRAALFHDQGIVTSVETWVDRFPYTTCFEAGTFLAAQVAGQRLDALAKLDPRVNCTHLYDLAVLAARHAGAATAVIFDIQVADRVEGRTRATLWRCGDLIGKWAVAGTVIHEPAVHSGRDLRSLSHWKSDLPEERAVHAALLRRGIQISGARRAPPVERAADRGAQRSGACFTYQSGQMEHAAATPGGLIDFSLGTMAPLEDFPGGRCIRAAMEGS